MTKEAPLNPFEPTGHSEAARACSTRGAVTFLLSGFLAIVATGVLAKGFWELLGTMSFMGVPDEELKASIPSIGWKACLTILIGIIGLCVATACVIRRIQFSNLQR